jgi:2-deoxy-D-gluconate 3-dehydrogenase
MKNLLDGKIAIVTGGNGGIGLGIAEGLAEEGANVIIASRNKDKNKTAIDKIKKISTDSETFELDVNNQDSINNLIEFAIEKYGKIDILVNNAGISRRSDEPHLLSKNDWDDVIDTNLNSIHHMTSAIFPHLKKNKSGKIINIGSMMSIFGNANSAAYAASKGGVVQYTKSCAIAWAKYNIQINAILPGWIVTDMTNEFKKVNPKRYATIAGRTPAERWGLPKDLAGTAIFLSSAFSDFVNGVSIPVDGGYSVM